MASNLSLPGLSGYDFSSIVNALVTNYSKPLTKMKTQQSALETKKNAWRDVNTRLSSLENTLAKLQAASTWQGTKASSSNSAILSASGASGAVTGTYNIKVIQQALAQTAASGLQAVEKSSDATALSEGVFKITVGDKTADIAISAGESLDNIAGAINNAKIGVSASVVQVEGGFRLAVISRQTGEENAAAFSEVTGSVLHDLGLLNDETVDGVTITNLNITQAAQDAVITINGIDQITSSSNTITSAIPGVTLSIADADPEKTVTVKVSADYSDAQAAVQAFVDQYNSVMSFIEGKLAYDKDTEIKGDLFADPSLQAIQSRLRQMVSGSVNNPTGPFTILSDIGISTSADDFGKSAALEFDTAKFTEAMEKNSYSVANLFGAPAGGVTPINASSDSQQAQGLANIMEEYLHPLIMYQGTLDKTVDGYSDQIDKLKDAMSDFTDKIADYQERLQLKYSRLESQLAAISSQSDWLTSMIESMSYYNSNNSNK
jgi:flagellar hook-associated protein 2